MNKTDDLLEGRVYSTSIINEPPDEPPLSAREKAERRWHMTAELLNEERRKNER
jgi:hypothetical protein